MALTTDQHNYIVELDREAKRILRREGESALLMSLAGKMESIKPILDAAAGKELTQYCAKYSGFYEYIKLLERLAQAAASGNLDDVLSQ